MKQKYMWLARTAARYAAALTAGVLSTAPKSGELYYLSAPALLALAPDCKLSAGAVLAGQALSIAVWSHQIRLLPTLVLLYLFTLAVKNPNKRRRSITPGLVGVTASLVAIACYFAGLGDEFDLILRICEALLSGCVVFFARYYLESTEKRGVFAAVSLSISICAVMAAVWCGDGYLTQLVMFGGIWLCGRISVSEGLIGGIPPALLGGVLLGYEALPAALTAIACMALLHQTGRKKSAACFAVSTALCQALTGVHDLLLYIPPVLVGGIAYFVPVVRSEEPPAAPIESLSDRYAGIVRQVDELERCGKITFLPQVAERAAALLRANGYREVNVTCAKDLPGGFFMDAAFFSEHTVSKDALLGQMERAAGCALSMRRFYEENGQIYAAFIRRAPYAVRCSAVCKTKSGETVCGDSAIAFSSDEEHYVLLLSDGMGSGKDAFAQSRWTVTLLRRLLRAGVAAEGAVSMVNSSLKLGVSEMGFATVDLCRIDLMDGSAAFIKAGAVSTYILRDNDIIEVAGVSMPLGMTDTADFARCRQKLSPGDIIVLLSDGATECKGEMLYTLQRHRSYSASELAKALMQSVCDGQSDHPDDDITVLVAKFERN